MDLEMLLGTLIVPMTMVLVVLFLILVSWIVRDWPPSNQH